MSNRVPLYRAGNCIQCLVATEYLSCHGREYDKEHTCVYGRMTQDAAHQTLTQPCELTRLQRQMKERLWNVLSYDAARGPQEDMDTQRMPLRSQAPDPLGRPQGGQPAPDRASRCPGPLTSPELSPPAAHPATRLQRSARHDAGFALRHGSNLVTFFSISLK